MKNLLKDLYNHKIMSKDESKAALISLTDGSANSSQISSFLTVFLMRDITSQELDGFRAVSYTHLTLPTTRYV